MGAGFLADYTWKFPGFGWTMGVTLGLAVYLLTFYAARYAWYRKLEPTKIGKIYSTGIGGFVMFFIFTWVLLATLS